MYICQFKAKIRIILKNYIKLIVSFLIECQKQTLSISVVVLLQSLIFLVILRALMHLESLGIIMNIGTERPLRNRDLFENKNSKTVLSFSFMIKKMNVLIFILIHDFC